MFFNFNFYFSKRLTFSVLCSLYSVLFLTGCAPVKEHIKEEVTLPPGVGDLADIRWVDNFDDSKDPNMIGGGVSTETKGGGVIAATYDREVALRDRGYSLKIDFNTPKGSEAKAIIDLNRLDISKAEGFCFWIKGKTGKEKFDIILTDWKGKKDVFMASKIFDISKKWQEVRIPKQDFETIDFNYMDKFILKFYPSQDSTVYIDNVYFYGPSYVFFLSIKDNLRDFPTKKIVYTEPLLELSDKKLLKRIAKDTWRYFDEAVDKRHDMICDYIDMNEDRYYRIGDYTSTTNLGLYFMCIISAWDLGYITRQDAIDRINRTFEVILNLPRWKDQWYNFYSTTNLSIARPYVSTVDNGWLAAGLMVVRQTFPKEFKEKATKLLNIIDFSLFYDKIIGQLHLGYEVDKQRMSKYHYGLIATEPRLTSFIAIGKGDVPKHHWFRVYRTLPRAWTWQTQIPKGKFKRIMGIDVFEGYYTYDGIKVVPSWGGSLFETLMPTIVMDEEKYAPESFGLNNKRVAKIHRQFMLDKKGYPVWGLSSCSTPDGGYSEFGVADIGTKGYDSFNIVTPHASILALPLMPDKVIDNIRMMLKLYDIYGEYGLYDSVNVDSGEVSYRYLCLDQGMILIQINNYLNDGIMQKRFHKDPIAKKAIDVLKIEEFF